MKLFKYLISNHYNVLAKDDNGDTPLHVAVGYGYTDAVKILVQYKPILINTPGNNHGFPIHTAALSKCCYLNPEESHYFRGFSCSTKKVIE